MELQKQPTPSPSLSFSSLFPQVSSATSPKRKSSPQAQRKPKTDSPCPSSSSSSFFSSSSSSSSPSSSSSASSSSSYSVRTTTWRSVCNSATLNEKIHVWCENLGLVKSLAVRVAHEFFSTLPPEEVCKITDEALDTD